MSKLFGFTVQCSGLSELFCLGWLKAGAEHVGVPCVVLGLGFRVWECSRVLHHVRTKF